MQLGLNISFFKNLVFQIQIIEASQNSASSQSTNVKKALLQWLKTDLEYM